MSTSLTPIRTKELQSSRPTRCLIVRPATPKASHGGDEVMYRRSIEYLARTMTVDICELQSVSRLEQILELLDGTPPELTRFVGEANREIVSKAIAVHSPDVCCFHNEVTFHCLDVAKAAGIGAVLFAHNVHSLVAATDPDLWARALKHFARRFERKWYADEAAELVCISRGDIAGLRNAGVGRSKIWISPPGCPPETGLADPAVVRPEIVLTGSYGWWRKRRDLKVFAEGAPLPAKIVTFDPTARDILGDQAASHGPADLDWSSNLRFGLITDRFLGGFKLKALEYVARNCVILSACDLSEEFRELPHASVFVRTIRSKEQAWQIIRSLQERSDTVSSFREFKAACLRTYNWETCLQPLAQAIEAALTANSGIRHHDARLG